MGGEIIGVIKEFIDGTSDEVLAGAWVSNEFSPTLLY